MLETVFSPEGTQTDSRQEVLDLMLELFAWSGRPCAAGGLLVVGIGLVMWGLANVARREQGTALAWLDRAFVYLHGFRRVVVGLCLVGAGVAWLEQVPWLLAASACVGAGELVESTYYIVVLRWGEARLGVYKSGS